MTTNSASKTPATATGKRQPKRFFEVNGKKYYNEAEYIAARDAFSNYRNEQEVAHNQAIEQDSKVNGTVAFTCLAGDQSCTAVWQDGKIEYK